MLYVSGFVPCQIWRVSFRLSTQSSRTSANFKRNREEEKISFRIWRLSGKRLRKLFLTGRFGRRSMFSSCKEWKTNKLSL